MRGWDRTISRPVRSRVLVQSSCAHIFFALVRGFEPSISAVRRRRPSHLDDTNRRASELPLFSGGDPIESPTFRRARRSKGEGSREAREPSGGVEPRSSGLENQRLNPSGPRARFRGESRNRTGAVVTTTDLQSASFPLGHLAISSFERVKGIEPYASSLARRLRLPTGHPRLPTPGATNRNRTGLQGLEGPRAPYTMVAFASSPRRESDSSSSLYQSDALPLSYKGIYIVWGSLAGRRGDFGERPLLDAAAYHSWSQSGSNRRTFAMPWRRSPN